MTGRQYMTDFREKRKATLTVMAKKAQVKETMLMHMEEDDQYVTSPSIARRIADAYKLTEEQYLTMIPLNYRPGPDYDPDRYVDNKTEYAQFLFAPTFGFTRRKIV